MSFRRLGIRAWSAALRAVDYPAGNRGHARQGAKTCPGLRKAITVTRARTCSLVGKCGQMWARGGCAGECRNPTRCGPRSATDVRPRQVLAARVRPAWDALTHRRLK